VLLCLLNIAFERPSHDRTISFAVIAAKTRIPIEQVEWVCMRAMSLGLLRGSIDEVYIIYDDGGDDDDGCDDDDDNNDDDDLYFLRS
jgi:hypothetical protein